MHISINHNSTAFCKSVTGDKAPVGWLTSRKTKAVILRHVEKISIDFRELVLS
jgi:hypothetical protein